MSKLISAARTFVAAEEGATMVEYGLMVALIAAFLIGTVKLLGSAISSQFTNVTNAING
jgi:pilus assembly protein Flp/PilA